MNTIWKWIKIIVFFIIGIGGAVVIYAMIQNRSKSKAKIEGQINEINNIEQKTDADLAELRRLEEEKKKLEETIQNTNNVFMQKVKDLMSEGKTSSAGQSADDLTDAWGGKK